MKNYTIVALSLLLVSTLSAVTTQDLEKRVTELEKKHNEVIDKYVKPSNETLQKLSTEVKALEDKE